MGYTKQQGQHLMERYHSDEEFRKRFIGYAKKYQKNHPFRAWAIRIRPNHKRRNIEVLISRIKLEQMANQTKICKLCGTTLEYGPREDSKNILNPNSASLDRKDVSKPFTLDNAQIICRQCNSAKSTMSTKEFIEYCKRIVARCDTN